MVMDDNPYAPPQHMDRATGVRSGRREDLKTIAVAQKSIIICILGRQAGKPDLRCAVPQRPLLDLTSRQPSELTCRSSWPLNVS
jgi:hypothetical protein